MDKKQAFENAHYYLRSTVPKKEEPTVRKGPGRLQTWTKEMEDNLKAALQGIPPQDLKQLTKLDNYEDADVPPDVRFPYRASRCRYSQYHTWITSEEKTTPHYSTQLHILG